MLFKGNCFNDNYVLIKDDDDTDEENFSQDDGELDDDNSEKEKNNINVPDCYPIGWRSIGKVKSQPLTSFSGPFSVEFEKDILRKLLFDDDDAKTKKRNHHPRPSKGYPHRWYTINIFIQY